MRGKIRAHGQKLALNSTSAIAKPRGRTRTCGITRQCIAYLRALEIRRWCTRSKNAWHNSLPAIPRARAYGFPVTLAMRRPLGSLIIHVYAVYITAAATEAQQCLVISGFRRAANAFRGSARRAGGNAYANYGASFFDE